MPKKKNVGATAPKRAKLEKAPGMSIICNCDNSPPPTPPPPKKCN